MRGEARKRQECDERERERERASCRLERASLFVIVVISFLHLFEHDCSLLGALLLIQHGVDVANASSLQSKSVEGGRKRTNHPREIALAARIRRRLRPLDPVRVTLCSCWCTPLPARRARVGCRNPLRSRRPPP